MTPTTPEALSAAFRTAIEAIVPRFAHASGTGWKYTVAARRRGRAVLEGADLRSFALLWSPGAPTLRCFHGEGAEEYEARMRVATSYAGVDPDDREAMTTADGVDLRRALAALSEPTVPGLSIALYEGAAVLEDDNSSAYVEHNFTVRWCQDTNGT